MKTDNTLYNRQTAILLFILTVTFKAAALPAMVAADAGSGGLTVYAGLFAVDVLGWILIKRYIDLGGAETLDNTSKKWLKIPIMIVLTTYFALKAVLCFSGTVDFVVSYMFENIKIAEAAMVLAVPCVYIAIKGIRTMGRVAEIVIVLVLTILVFNLLFIKTDADFSRNLPIFSMPMKDYLENFSKWSFWFGDFMPLLFVKEKQDGKKRSPWALTAAVCFVLFTYVLMFAIYGRSLVIVKNAMLKYGVFNHLETYLGRLDWTIIVIWIPMAIITCGAHFWAATESARRIVKKKTVAEAAIFLCIAVYFFFAPDAMQMTNFAKGALRYVALAVNFAMPPVLLLCAAGLRKEAQKNEEAR